MTDENHCSAGDLLHLDALGPDGDYRTRNTETVTTAAGVAVARLSLVPPLYVSRTLGAQRKAAPLPPADRQAALSRAAEVFTDGVIAGLDFEAYAGLAARISGLPVAITRAAARGMADGLG
ncbi:aldehyde dehydrogenase, partial [Mycobacterium avium subsp. hominissuis]|nr:aldehyde dehydrogenase [Mycobacterium avium subsp. hominissuis]